jgi:hypothetical protein
MVSRSLILGVLGGGVLRTRVCIRRRTIYPHGKASHGCYHENELDKDDECRRGELFHRDRKSELELEER